MNQPCSKRPLSAFTFSCESCIKTHFFHRHPRLILFPVHLGLSFVQLSRRSSQPQLLFVRVSPLQCSVHIERFSVCLDPSSVETQQFHLFFTSLFVLRQPRPTSPHFSVEKLTDAFFSEFELHRVDVSLSWREKNPIHRVTFNLQRVCVPATSSPRLFVVVDYGATLTLGQTRFSLYLLPGCLNSVSGLLTRCERDAKVAFIEPTQRRFNCHDILLV